MKIKIHNYIWTVQTVQSDSEKMNPEPDHYLAGLTEYADQAISIREGMSRERTRTTVIHELIHAFIDSFGYTSDCMTEEEICDFFGANADDIIRLTDTIMEGVIDGADRERDCKPDN